MCPTNIGVSATLLCLTLLTASAQQLATGDEEFLQKAAKGGMHEVNMGKMGMQRGSSPEVKKYSERLVSDHKKSNQELMALAKRKGVTLSHDFTDGGSKSKSHDSAQSGNQAGNHGQSQNPIVAGQSSSHESSRGGTTNTRSGSGNTGNESSSRNKESYGNAPATARSTDARHGADSLEGKSGSEFDKEFSRLAVSHHEEKIAAFEKAANSSNDSDVRAWANKTLPALRSHLKAAQSLKQ